MDYEEQLRQLKVLAGIYKPYDVSKHQENISYTGTEKGEYQRKNMNGSSYGLRVHN